MKKYMMPIIVVAVVIAIVIAMAISGGSPEKKLIGSWTEEGRDYLAYEFFGDGTVYGGNMSGDGEWYLEGNKLKIKTWYDTDVYEIEFKGNVLILDGERYVRYEED